MRIYLTKKRLDDFLDIRRREFDTGGYRTDIPVDRPVINIASEIACTTRNLKFSIKIEGTDSIDPCLHF